MSPGLGTAWALELEGARMGERPALPALPSLPSAPYPATPHGCLTWQLGAWEVWLGPGCCSLRALGGKDTWERPGAVALGVAAPPLTVCPQQATVAHCESCAMGRMTTPTSLSPTRLRGQHAPGTNKAGVCTSRGYPSGHPSPGQQLERGGLSLNSFPQRGRCLGWKLPH